MLMFLGMSSSLSRKSPLHGAIAHSLSLEISSAFFPETGSLILSGAPSTRELS